MSAKLTHRTKNTSRQAPTLVAIVLSNPSTGAVGFSLVQKDLKTPIRIGGLVANGPAKQSGLEKGDVVLEINGEDTSELSLHQAVFMLTENKGQKISISVKKSIFDFDSLLEEPRTVWFQCGEPPHDRTGLQLVVCEEGPRVSEILENSPARSMPVSIGDRVIEVNENVVAQSSLQEVLAALNLDEKIGITLVLEHDSSELKPSDANGGQSYELGDTLADGMQISTQWQETQMLAGSTKGKRKVITIMRDDKDPANGLGMIILGTLDDQGTRISEITPNGSADRSGRIRVGDRILFANGMDLHESSFKETSAALSLNNESGGLQITLVLEEDPSPLNSNSISPEKKSKKARRKMEREKKKKDAKENKLEGDLGPIRTVTIDRPAGAGLGLKILTDDAVQTARISEIIAGRAAEKCGGINVGDRLIAANGISLISLTHEEIVEVMLRQGDKTELQLRSDSAPLFDDSFRKTVTIHREPGEGLGLKIHSTTQADGLALGARISEVIPGKAASKTGNILPGDWLIEANGTNLYQVPHEDIVQVLVSLTSEVVTLVLEPDDSAIEDVEDDSAQYDTTVVFGEPKLLTNERTVLINRSEDGMLGFQFYSEVGQALDARVRYHSGEPLCKNGARARRCPRRD